MKKIRLVTLLLGAAVVMGGCFKGEGKVRVAADKEDMLLYVDGDKKATVGTTYTDMLIEEGDHEFMVLKVIDDDWVQKGSKNVFVGADTSVKVDISSQKAPSEKRLERLAKEKAQYAKTFPRVSANVIEDTATGLYWQDDNDAQSVEKSWSEAKTYCANLSLDGHDDWRLPSYNELLSIVDYNRYDPAIVPVFENTASNDYWSSSAYVDDSSDAWYVDFKSGFTYNSVKSSSSHVRCVRGRQAL